jgi:hypothetical protein
MRSAHAVESVLGALAIAMRPCVHTAYLAAFHFVAFALRRSIHLLVSSTKRTWVPLAIGLEVVLGGNLK